MLLPAFSRIAHDPARFREAFLRVLGLLWFAACPLAGLVVVLGEATAVVLLGEEWRGAGVALVAMAGLGPGVALSAVATEAIKGHGQPHLLNRVTLVSAVVWIGALAALLPFGLVGVGLALSLDAVLCGLLTVLLARRVVTVTLGEVAGSLLPPVLATLAAATVTVVLDSVVSWPDMRPLSVVLSVLAARASVFVVVFVVVMVIVAPARSAAVHAALRQFVRSTIPGSGRAT